MSHIASNLYAITSLDPITEDRDGIQVFACLPVDFTEDGGIADTTRFETIVSVPSKVNNFELLSYFEDARAFAAQWLTYCWEVAA